MRSSLCAIGWLMASVIAVPCHLCLAAPPVRENDERDETQPLSARQELASFEIRDGFQIDLVACEPLLKDPVAIDWDVRGRLWVVEMADYPLGMDGKGQAGGRVRILEDTNGDGRYDKSSLFLDGLNFPTGIITWRDGVLITAAPDILYAEDTDGDGRADSQTPLFSGFNEGNQQLRMNGLRWGLDNWIHCASGSHHAGYGKDTGVTIKQTGASVVIGSRDFRIRPDSHQLDPQSGPSQYGRNRDDWGNWFGVQNSYPLWHYVLQDDEIRRNPHFAPPNPRHDLTESNPTVYPIKKPQKRFHSFENATQFTSACSGIVYRDTQLFDDSGSLEPPQHTFTCAPFHSLVQHNVLRESGTTFTLARDPDEDEREFFASRDRWCRPVMVRTGPDGALWIVDFYRYMIEHPEWVNQAARAELRPYYRHGEEQGRIWRVSRPGRLGKIPHLADLSTQQLVARLEDSNGWIRDKCQQLLIWRADQTAIPLLRNLAMTSAQPLARLHAICTLAGIDADRQSAAVDAGLNEETLSITLRDDHPGVRRHAVRLAGERRLLHELLLTMVHDPNPKVRLQLASSLGEFPEYRTGFALSQLLTDPQNDRYIRAAAMSSISEGTVSATLSGVLVAEPLDQDIVRELCRFAVKTGNQKAVDLVVQQILALHPKSADKSVDALSALLDVVSIQAFDTHPQREAMDVILNDAETVVGADNVAESVRLKAIQLWARREMLDEVTLEHAGRLLSPRQSPAMHTATLARLSKRSEQSVADLLLANWESSGPTLRLQIATALLARKAWTEALIQSIEAKHVPAEAIPPAARRALLDHNDKRLRQQAQRLFAGTATNRQAVIEVFEPALEMPADPAAGAKVFENKCATCHRMGEVGKDLGPNLAALTDKSPRALLTSILDPNAAVEAKYVSYSILDADGRVHSGIIKAETASSIRLVTTEGQEISVLRNRIDEFSSSGKSWMPDGLEEGLSLQDVADLIGFLREPSLASAHR